MGVSDSKKISKYARALIVAEPKTFAEAREIEDLYKQAIVAANFLIRHFVESRLVEEFDMPPLKLEFKVHTHSDPKDISVSIGLIAEELVLDLEDAVLEIADEIDDLTEKNLGTK